MVFFFGLVHVWSLTFRFLPLSMWNNAVNAWWPLLFYPATDAPRFTKGMITMMCTCGATLGVTWLVWYLERRERRRDKEKTERTQTDSA